MSIANLVNTKVAKVVKYQPHGGSNQLLISTFRWALGYRIWENHCKGQLFTYGSSGQGVGFHWDLVDFCFWI